MLRKIYYFKYLLTIFVSVLCLVPCVSSSAVLLDRVVAVVNKEVITWSELYKMMEAEATDQVKALDEQEHLKIFKDNEAVFLEKLIDVRLQIQEAKKLGFNVSPQEVDEAIENIKKKYSLTDEALKESLKKEGLTFEEYKEKLGEQLLISQGINQQIRNKVVVSDEEVEKYIKSHQFLSDGETYRIRQILLKKPKDEAEIKGTEEKASLIMQRLKAGEDFSSLAKEYSEDPSAKQGGDLGDIKQSLMAKEFIDILDKMKPGDFSDPFWTERGLHIVTLDEKIAKKNMNELKEDVKKQLAEERFLEKYKGWIKGLREQARIEIRL